MGEGGNLIKQTGRRRKWEWSGDRSMPTPSGMAFALIPDGEEMVLEEGPHSVCPEIAVIGRMRNGQMQIEVMRRDREGGCQWVPSDTGIESGGGGIGMVVSRWWYEEMAGGKRVKE